MSRDLTYVHKILSKIESGNMTFQVISSEVAEMIGVPIENRMTQAEADKAEEHLNELELRGLIEIEDRSPGGFFTVRRMTWKGREFLASLRAN